MDNYYKIAGLTVKMSPWGRTEEQARPYLCQPVETVDIEIDSRIQKMMARHPELDEETAMYVHSGIVFNVKLLDFGGMMLHSSAVVVDEKAYLFSADSGTGKSTHTELWLKHFGDRAYILNDDKPALRVIDGVWYACGTPWSGKNDINRPTMVPLAGVAVLNRGTTNQIAPMDKREAVYHILAQTNRSKTRPTQVLEMVDKLVSEVPIWKLYCNMDPEAALVSYRAMSGNEKE